MNSKQNLKKNNYGIGQKNKSRNVGEQREMFLPPDDIRYTIYSSKIWRKFLNQLQNINSRIVDFGCGRGTTLYCLEKLGFKKLHGVDLYKSIPKHFLRETKFKVGDVTKSKYNENYFDGLVSSMVIEHVDDRLFSKEIYRVLKPGGIALITSVLKNKFAVYFYKNDKGEMVIEPSHLREYNNIQDFVNIFSKYFEVLLVEKKALCYPVIDPFFRLLYKLTKKQILRDLPTRHSMLKALRKIRFPIPGYFSVEILLKKLK